ncbi:sugar ABC transporter permease [Brevibacillus humidisoli]|uniref:carbohydrate ABC transporter permease n=1 Tax=Brevibacillus humidisoli TaxID=2895522 RepID=UPI001E3F8122|nr:sugar ABC transporter permease [Brevibacillus humidisoli]UFJ42713.1 sugar ABC transporter permease [Brevibacillus humidisoli]
MRTAFGLRPYLYLTPSLIVFALFFLYPILYLVYLSFTSWNLINPVKEYVGLDNYRELLADPEFVQVLGNTLFYTVVTVSISLLLGLLMALWLNRRGWFYSLIQGAVFSPYIISLVSVSLLWLWMMDPQYGLLNALLHMVGLPPSQWLADTSSAIWGLILVSVWKIVGYNTLICVAGLQSIPKELYEAAALDKTPAWRRFVAITLPMLSPTLFFLLVVNTIASFQVFDTVKIMTQGGPVNSTNMLVFFIYEYGFDFFKIGYAAAAGVVLLILVGVLTAVHFMLLAKRVHYR